ncbi:hypothetical protein EJ08DRAFT_700246 [Tothia fuscella]|uniref:Uncharacterized protein n=1 Tax=Tothia fuscella TaxID=1048955 RepID=A0A9P4TW14_9PEZI|nr:hypothetical protein EJ08DRAFT_700246 [Tothia fuscella]
MACFSDLSTELVNTIVEKIWDGAEPVWTLKRLALADRRMNDISRDFLFQNITIGPLDSPSEVLLDLIDFLVEHTEILPRIRCVRLELRGTKYNFHHHGLTLLDRVSTFLISLERLKTIVIGGDPYSLLYEPCLGNAFTNRFLASLKALPSQIALKLHVYNSGKDSFADLKTPPNLQELRFCIFDDYYRSQHEAGKNRLRPVAWNAESRGLEVRQLLEKNQGLKRLHIVTHRDDGGQSYKRLEWDEAVYQVIEMCGALLSDSPLTSIALEGTFHQRGFWDRGRTKSACMTELWNSANYTTEHLEIARVFVSPRYEWGLTGWELCENQAEMYSAHISEVRELHRKYEEHSKLVERG